MGQHQWISGEHSILMNRTEDQKLIAEDLASCQAGQRLSELVVQLGFFICDASTD